MNLDRSRALQQRFHSRIRGGGHTFDTYPGQIACLILEPATYLEPGNGFLHEARRLCAEHGALFILDQIITGFRWHLNRAQRYYVIVHDLSTFGKALGNGFSIVLIGKIRARRSYSSGYRLLHAFWNAGFRSDSEDGISVPEPVRTIPQFRMWLQRKVPGRPATELLATAGGVALARRIAEAACKVHRAGISPPGRHTMVDELKILRTRLPTVALPGSHWAGRIARLLDAADRLGASTPETGTRGIHRDLYPDQVIVDGERLFLIDFDLYCEGDPALDIGNALGHITEYSLRTLGAPQALADREQAMEERFVELSGEATRAAVRAYASLTLVRHVHLSTLFPERRSLTRSLIELCEERLEVTRGPTVSRRRD